MIDFEDPLGLEKPQKPIPRALLWAALVLMMVSVSLAGYSRATGNGAVREVEPREAGIPLWVSFAASEEDQDVIEARAHPSGDLLLALESGEGGFLRGVVRPLQRERMRFGVDQSLPYRLTAHANGPDHPGGRRHGRHRGRRRFRRHIGGPLPKPLSRGGDSAVECRSPYGQAPWPRGVSHDLGTAHRCCSSADLVLLV